MAEGFALECYLVPHHGLQSKVRGGTMPKAPCDTGGLFADVQRAADRAPGPGHYHKEMGNKSFVHHAKGGHFSKVSREERKSLEKSPAVGQYINASKHTTPRTLGGLMSKTDRKPVFAKMAEKLNEWNPSGPGKYDPKPMEAHRTCPTFHSPRTESRTPRKPSGVGPGYYKPQYTQTEKSTPKYSGSKEDAGSYASKAKPSTMPFPCYKDAPESKVCDRLGTKKHLQRLLADKQASRQSTPRPSFDRASLPAKPSTAPEGASRRSTKSDTIQAAAAAQITTPRSGSAAPPSRPGTAAN